MLGEYVSFKFLLFVEEIALRIHNHEARLHSEQTRLLNLLTEIFKRILNLQEKQSQLSD